MGEIKIRLFITPILFLLGKGRCQLSTVNCQLTTSTQEFHANFIYM
ncbi:MAG: hypothetical protein JGK01_11920 [Microcoleus sp. PH2017_03_ELD_O_A]|nr:hypothetical protein [Microcoleus sp. PH2017_32_RDM_D_A]MCC3429311.1 hypothetical protein [Microcoleus sp. PH2017_04_SCI_O_A]MCC3442484.1 hypothetical protein [Microcoleus sp. PH2017_03_ELD_O_A]MCC3509243.1 hypothetical protein [Microcoleus sp. PH2017_17_BER_D_A]